MRTALTFGLSAFAAAMLIAPIAHASECFQLAQAPQASPLHKANFVQVSETEPKAKITFLGHSTYAIEDPDGLTIATDWSGHQSFFLDEAPDVITMNRAHATHWTHRPDPEIEHVLPGWGEKGKPAHHFLRLGDTLIRNVPTDTRGGDYGAEPFGNSIFLFEMAGLCIGHLGHIHHTPTEEQFALLGRIDILMVPVDGGFTLSLEELLPLTEKLRSQVVLPMHAFGRWSLNNFLDDMREAGFEVKHLDGNDLSFTQKTLPERPTVFVPKGV